MCIRDRGGVLRCVYHLLINFNHFQSHMYKGDWYRAIRLIGVRYDDSPINIPSHSITCEVKSQVLEAACSQSTYFCTWHAEVEAENSPVTIETWAHFLEFSRQCSSCTSVEQYYLSTSFILHSFGRWCHRISCCTVCGTISIWIFTFLWHFLSSFYS